MKALRLEEILDLEAYEQVRPEYRARIIAHKKERRVGVGDRVTLVFEDRETLRYQIQEMTRIEKTRDPERVRDELDVYNELVPGEGELSATLFIEIPELPEIRTELDRLVGIDEHVFLVLGEGQDEEVAQAFFDRRQMEDERISAVQYIRFALDSEGIARFARDARARIRIDHPNYRAEAEIGPAMRESLLRDLRSEPLVLLDAELLSRSTPPKREIVFEHERVRAYRPAQRQAPEHVVVEPTTAITSPLEIDPALITEVWKAVQRCVREISERGVECRVLAEVGAGRALRFEVIGTPRERPH